MGSHWHQYESASSSMWGVKPGSFLWFWIHCKHLFCIKIINSAQNAPTKLWFSDESSLFTVLWGLFLAQRMFLEQNKCLQWIQNHHKPLVWHLNYYLKQMYFDVFLPYTVKSMGPKLSSEIPSWFHLRCKWNHGFSDSVHPDVSKNV